MKDVKTAIEVQLAVAREINSDFITLTTGEGKRILKLLKEQPDIVRCKYCRYCHGINEGCGARSFYPPSGDWYCADGKRRSD